MPTPAEKTVAAYFAATRTMNKKAWVDCFAPDGATHDPVGAPPHVGPAALGAFFDGIVGLVKTIGLHEDHVFVSGNHIAVKWTGRGLSKSGKPFTVEGIDAFECDAKGKIKLLRAYWDPAQLMAQVQ